MTIHHLYNPSLTSSVRFEKLSKCDSPLGEVQISNGEQGILHKYGKVGLGSSREILDVCVTSMLTTGNSSSSFAIDLLSKVVRKILTDVGSERQRSKGERRTTSWVGGDEFSFSLVPEIEEFLRGRGTDQSGMSDTAESNTGNVTRRGVD